MPNRNNNSDDYDDFDVGDYVDDIEDGGRCSFSTAVPGIKKLLSVHIVPEDKNDPYGKCRVLLLNINNDIPDDVAVYALEDVMYKTNPMQLDLGAIYEQDEKDHREAFKEAYGVPLSLKELFFVHDQYTGTMDISKEVDKKKPADIFGIHDENDSFKIIDFDDPETVDYILHRGRPAYVMIRTFLKKGYEQIRLIVNPLFEVVDPEKYIIGITKCSDFIDFKPFKRIKDKRRKTCQK